MNTKEQITQELSSLNSDELKQVAQYLAFLKYQSHLKSTKASDEAQLAALYAEFVEEDHLLAEEGMADYAGALAKEDI
jgi:hypothetical protein